MAIEDYDEETPTPAANARGGLGGNVLHYMPGFMSGYTRGASARRLLEEKDLEIEQNRLKTDMMKREDTAMGEFADLLKKYNGGDTPENAETPDRVGFGLYANPSVLKNPKFLTEAAGIFTKHKLPAGVEWLKRAYGAEQENFVTALKVAQGGDLEGAERVFNGSGRQKVKEGTLRWDDPEKTTLAGVDDTGRSFKVNVDEMLRNFLSPEEYLTRARGDYFAGRNEANVRGREVSAEARVTAADIAAGARTSAAETAAAARNAGRGTTGTTRPAAPRSSSAPYGGDRGQAKWTDDLEKHYMPKRDAKDDEGKVRMDPKTAQPVQEVDEDLAPTVRDLARVNAEVLNAAGVHPQEASNVFASFARAFKGNDRAKAFTLLDKAGRIAIAEKDGEPVKAVGIMGQYRDAQGRTRPIFFDLPEKMSDELVTQEVINRVEKERNYRDERGWSPRAAPTAAQRARAGVGGGSMPPQKFLPEPRNPGGGY